MRWIILCLATLLVAANSLSAPEHPVVIRLDGSTIPAAEVDQTVTRLMKAGDVAGVTIAILNGGKISYVKAYGLRDKDKNLPLTVNSVMSAGSFSNVVFAYMVMQVVAEGVLNLDKPIYKYLPKPLPEYPDYADLADDPRWKHITPRMLLSQTSGFADWRTSESDRKLKIHFKPGTRFAYSSEGIDLLQLVVETVTQTHLEELMQEHVFDPLGMTRTSMVSIASSKMIMPTDMGRMGGRWVRGGAPSRLRQSRCRRPSPIWRYSFRPSWKKSFCETKFASRCSVRRFQSSQNTNILRWPKILPKKIKPSI